LLIALGVYWSLNGYRAFEGDQAYRLPLLIDRLEPGLYARDPFVRAFDRFNPHGGYLAVLETTTRVMGLSGALLFWFCLTFLMTAWGIWRLGRAAWRSDAAGWVAVGLMLSLRAGCIGTNHLFEPMLLDRLMTMALGWVAVAELVEGKRWAPGTVAALTAVALWIHPSLGLQLGLWLAAGWVFFGCLEFGTSHYSESSCGWIGTRKAGEVGGRGWLGASRSGGEGSGPVLREGGTWYWVGLGMMGLVLMPAVARVPAQAATLMRGLSAEDYYRLAALVQSPQHLVPHLWRLEQWGAWLGLVGLGGLALAGAVDEGIRRRLLVLFGLIGASLAAAWLAIEVVGDVRVTLFQPFRMATVARGLAVVGLAGWVLALWSRGTLSGYARAGLIVGGLTADWSCLVALGVESVIRAVEALRAWGPSERTGGSALDRGPARGWVEGTLLLVLLGAGLVWLARHDTREGVMRLGGGLGAGVAWGEGLRRWGRLGWSTARGVRLVSYAWMVPVAAGLVAVDGVGRETAVGGWLMQHLRFGEWAIDDEERLGGWCRANLPPDAVLVGPPGPKGLRLWSRRAVAFNRAASPYHAEGLADWARRYCDHVGLPASPAALAEAYLADRHALEARYDHLDAAGLAALARRQGASHVVARPGLGGSRLEPLHQAGGLAVYRVVR
jgi:hypothetical protein